jgi:hypothetical protein
MGIAIFLWGPEKGAEIAKKLGSARRDLEAATKQLQGMSKELGTGMGTGGLDGLLGGLIPGISGNPTPEEIAQATRNGGGTVVAPGAAKPGEAVTPVPNILGAAMATTPATSTAKSGVTSGDRLLVDMARKLGISTQGKSRDDIQNEIIARASQTPAQPAEAVPVKAPETPPEAVPAEQAQPNPQVEQPTAVS